MLLGTYSSKLDSKNRLFVPSVLSREFQSEILYLTSLKEFILVSTQETFERLVECYLSQRAEQLRENYGRGIYSSTFSCKIDSQKRILLPANLVNEHNISSQVIWVGMKDYAEIWNGDDYHKWLTVEFPDGLSYNDFKLKDDFSKSFKPSR